MIDQNILKMLADGVSSEASDSGTAQALTSVVGNRMNQPEKYGMSFPEIIMNTFPNIGKSKIEEPVYKRAIASAGNYLRGTLTDTTNGATHFLKKGSKTKDGLEKTHSTSSHNFYKEAVKNVSIKSKRKTLR